MYYCYCHYYYYVVCTQNLVCSDGLYCRRYNGALYGTCEDPGHA